jgi:DNA-binding CsgD family transcriptional regulator
MTGIILAQEGGCRRSVGMLFSLRDNQSLKIEFLFCYNIFTMSIWQRILYWIGLRNDPGPRFYEFSESMQTTLSTLAEFEGQPEDELAETIFASGLDYYYAQEENWKLWETLTPREKDVAAYACLGYTNKQIANQMFISPETVKSHLRNALAKFGFRNRNELRLLLKNWDFSEWTSIY